MGGRADHSQSEAYTFLGTATYTDTFSHVQKLIPWQKSVIPLAIRTIPQIVEENDLFIDSCDKIKLSF